MRYISDLKDGSSVKDIYLCKKRQSLVTRAGKAYESLTFQDKTGTIDAKIWDPDSMGIGEFGEMDYVDVSGEVITFQGHLQLNVRRARLCHEGEYDPADYLPVTERNIEDMFKTILKFIDSIENPYLKQLLEKFFVEDTEFVKAFKLSSAAKSVHHGFIGGLCEHTLGVAQLCHFYCKCYPLLKRDLLVSVALLHDIGKVRELSAFPRNDYTEEGQLIGHIVIGCEMINDKIKEIDGFPSVLAAEVRHCILAHHGEYEFGSPKKPAIIEAAALNFADNTDAKMEIFKEAIMGTTVGEGWIGYQSFLSTNVRKTTL